LLFVAIAGSGARRARRLARAKRTNTALTFRSLDSQNFRGRQVPLFFDRIQLFVSQATEVSLEQWYLVLLLLELLVVVVNATVVEPEVADRGCLLQLAVLLLLLPGESHAYKLPDFSWDTLPVAWHNAIPAETITPGDLAVLAKYPLVTLEKTSGAEVFK
jgi:Flp pilus assembly protein TadB